MSTEAASNRPLADIIPHTDPGAIEFSHVFLEAENDNDAYDRGWHVLPPRKPGTVMNDYVVAFESGGDLPCG